MHHSPITLEMDFVSQFFFFQILRCLAVYMPEVLRLKAHILQAPPWPKPVQQITSLFPVLPSARGIKRQTDIRFASNSRSVQTQGTIPLPQRPQRQPDQISPKDLRDNQTRSLTNRQLRSLRPQRGLILPHNSTTEGPDLPQSSVKAPFNLTFLRLA